MAALASNTLPEDEPFVPAPSPLHELNARRRHKPLRELPTLLREAVHLVWRAAPRDATVIVVINAVTGILTALQLAIAQRLLQAVLHVQNGRAASTVVPELTVFVVVLTLLGGLTLYQNEKKRVLSELVTRYSQVLVATAAAEADLVDFERPAFHDRLQRTMVNATTRPVAVTYALMDMVTSVFTLVGVIIALAIVQPILLALALVAFGPLWVVARRLSRLSFAFDVEETEADRRRHYLLMLLSMKEPAKELRAYELADFFITSHGRLWDERIGRLRRYTQRRIRLGALGQLINGLLLGAVVALLVWLLSTGRTSVSDAAVAAGAILLLGQRASSLVTSGGQLYEAALFLGDVQDFLDQTMERRREAPAQRPELELAEIRLDDVHFRYPSGNHDALAGVSVAVHPGEVVALVGANGSGKTTLAKMLAQLYEPDTGAVYWNGTDATTLDRVALRDQIAIIFQDFERYMFSAAENIGFGRSDRLADRGAIEDAARQAGAAAFLEALGGRYDALLGPEFIGGSDLSIGQWQRVAIARAFFRDANLVILDEPSSALDADAEAALFDRLRELCAGRAVVVVSHRFSTVTSADRIYVLDAGRVVEEGTHTDLVAADGAYARMFHLQAAQYLDGDGGTLRG
ncbi:MAG: transporter ATP-binding protein [Actinomycetia bacterium]|nr:transporter ATP-binding protein [Actinomycetes bacterium]